MIPRKLSVININDDPVAAKEFKDFATKSDSVTVHTICSEHDVQKLLLAPLPVVDIYLVDINMERNFDDENEGLWWAPEGEGKGKALYGPLLALPFLQGSAVARFVPYSFHLKSSVVQDNGFVVVALSLLMSHVDRKPYSLAEVRQRLKAMGSRPAATDAMDKGLEDLRARLKKGIHAGDIACVDGVATRERLADLKRHCKESSGSCRFEDGQGAVSFTYVHTHGKEDIRLDSLFADRLDFSATVERDRFPSLVSAVDTWLEDVAEEASPGCYVKDGKSLYRRAVAALEDSMKEAEKREQDRTDPNPLRTATTKGRKNKARKNKARNRRAVAALEDSMKEAEKREQDRTDPNPLRTATTKGRKNKARKNKARKNKVGKNLYDVRRLAMLLAWVEGWCDLKHDGATGKLTSHVRGQILGLTGSSAVNLYNELLGSGPRAAGGERRSFWKGVDRATPAYQLWEAPNGATCALTPWEKFYCRKYAFDKLRWNGEGAESYPDWMS